MICQCRPVCEPGEDCRFRATLCKQMAAMLRMYARRGGMTVDLTCQHFWEVVREEVLRQEGREEDCLPHVWQSMEDRG